MENVQARVYGQEPRIDSDAEGLIRILSDTIGNEFNAEDREVGSELIIDYPSRSIFDLRVIYYIVCLDNVGKRYWGELGKRQWVPDGKLSFCGSWRDNWIEE